MKPLVIYHANCADGFGAAFAAWLKLGDDAEYLPCQHGETIARPLDLKGREVYILDFSFKKHHMDYIFENAQRVVWLDHHKTSFDMWCPDWFCYDDKGSYFEDNFAPSEKHYILLDNNKSGALLAWEYFHPGNEPHPMFEYIDDYDRWQFKLKDTKPFMKGLWSYAPWGFDDWSELKSEYGRFDTEEFIYDGKAILRAHDQNVRSVLDGSGRACTIRLPGHHLFDDSDKVKPASIIDRNGQVVLGLCKVCGRGECELTEPCSVTCRAANCPPHLVSDVGHELAKQSGTFGLCWTLSKEGLLANCSLRSIGNYDVGEIAKAFGGGGHKNSAGFEVPINTLLGWLK